MSMNIMPTMQVGELVKIMQRGAVTLPAKYRKTFGLEIGQVVNVVPVKPGILVMPVDIFPRKADWLKETTGQYMKKVRYNGTEKKWVQEARETPSF